MENHFLLFLTICVTFFAGCVSSPVSAKATRLTAEEIFDSLKQQNPNGVLTGLARQAMEKNGFSCDYINAGSFRHKLYPKGAGQVQYNEYDQIEFLRCLRTTQNGMVTSYEVVALVIENNEIAKLLANYDAVGP